MVITLCIMQLRVSMYTRFDYETYIKVLTLPMSTVGGQCIYNVVHARLVRNVAHKYIICGEHLAFPTTPSPPNAGRGREILDFGELIIVEAARPFRR